MNHLIAVVSHILPIAVFIVAANAFIFAQRPTATPPSTAKSAEQGSQTQRKTEEKEGWSYDPDAGFVYRKNDFKASVAGYIEGKIRALNV